MKRTGKRGGAHASKPIDKIEPFQRCHTPKHDDPEAGNGNCEREALMEPFV